MDKHTFYKAALKSGAYVKKDWIYRIFSVVRQDNKPPYPYKVDYLDSIVGGWVPVGDELIFNPFPEHPSNTPLFQLLDRVDVTPDDIPNMETEANTTCGNLLVNWMVLVYSFGNKIPFMLGKISAKDIENIVEKRLIADDDNPVSSKVKDPIYVSEWVKCAGALGQVAGLSSLCVPSATAKAITPPPGIVEFRKELYERFQGKLNDPATIAEIDRLMVEFDKAWLGDDDIVNFYIKGKSYDVIRKKLFLSVGLEVGFSDDGEFDIVPRSLYEGWDMDKLPTMVNTLREGSYSRGAMTAMGGWSVKFFYRIMQNAKIGEEDCQSKEGVKRRLTEQNIKHLSGYYYVKNGKTHPFTEEFLKANVGNYVTMRSPMYCYTEGSGYCQRCLGDTNSETPTGLGALAAEVGSQFMLWRMGAMHGSSLKTARYNHMTSMS